MCLVSWILMLEQGMKVNPSFCEWAKLFAGGVGQTQLAGAIHQEWPFRTDGSTRYATVVLFTCLHMLSPWATPFSTNCKAAVNSGRHSKPRAGRAKSA